ncbi:dihydroneopterin aldolase family protein [Natrialbaceae archaeon AArc-T1-2]|uniref:dihydroneopterin aldolase family protein n=1 Tax=Natrialbaceae archaeon AArc-T1-2 TaxID=3053904 RepID=UPI00255B3B8D|nr:dihydroneopterin aldolase family protein [Natrialbaceae archaeon AArc-T1-2]WIV68416.1 dihydroneopterin aldolase family protein [Natrialbaceae archaeon AArc-T1-2]
MADDPTGAERACFEAGIKFGSLYHQFAGTPVSPASAASLETAIEEAIENQPHCEAVRVDILREELADALEDSSADYTELTGRFLEVEIDVDYEGRTVHTRMEMDDGYPLMRIVSVRRTNR